MDINKLLRDTFLNKNVSFKGDLQDGGDYSKNGVFSETTKGLVLGVQICSSGILFNLKDENGVFDEVMNPDVTTIVDIE